MNVEKVELQARFGEKAEKRDLFPHVYLEPAIERGSVPYAVEVDVEKCAKYMVHAGLTEDEAAKVNIKIHRKAAINPYAFLGPITGLYTPFSPDDVTLYCDWALKKNEMEYRDVGGTFMHEVKHLIDHKRKSPAVMGTWAVEIGSVLGAHSLLEKSGVYKAVDEHLPASHLINTALHMAVSIPFLTAGYYFDPLEIRARKASRQDRSNPAFSDMIVIYRK